MNRNFKIAIIVGIVSIVIISSTLVIHFRLSESEKSEVQSGAEQNEKETPSQVANEIVNSIQNKPSSESNESGESPGSESNESTEQTTTPIASTTTITIKQVDGVYMWSNVTAINPTITLVANMKNPLHFTNPTDTKHSFIIEQNGTVFLQTKDLEAGLSGNISIKPTITGIFDYHCKYHPDTMKGILLVIP
ncbi:MAG: cupredoxin domain-containing protein [Nitrosarchaeum sp.]|nr:cupredoxin domain-containing protein [Nitrosarchaeum sp.]